jgi:hypothetical protein
VDIRKSQAIALRLPQFRAEVADLEMRLETLRNVLPEEKDMGDLLRRLQTLAVQSNLTIRGFKPGGSPVTKPLHAEWPINLRSTARTTTWRSSSTGGQVPASFASAGSPSGQGPAGTGFDDHRRLRGHDVRAPGDKKPAPRPDA